VATLTASNAILFKQNYDQTKNTEYKNWHKRRKISEPRNMQLKACNKRFIFVSRRQQQMNSNKLNSIQENSWIIYAPQHRKVLMKLTAAHCFQYFVNFVHHVATQ